MTVIGTVQSFAVVAAVAAVAPLVTAQQPAAPPRPRITGISHVAFRVSDGAAARKFYGELIGLSERASAAKGHLIFPVGSHQYLRSTGELQRPRWRLTPRSAR
jgi:catechol-2,3-dioxygenase